jgi:hypothetical protein
MDISISYSVMKPLRRRLINYSTSYCHNIITWVAGAFEENLKDLIREVQDHSLACLLFGFAAWKTAPGDAFIGWTQKDLEGNLRYLMNKMRFLILPWVRVPHLASHSRIARRIIADWHQKYGHPVYLMETLVDRSLFRGICYKSANWILTGQTKGCTRNDRNHNIQTTVKDVDVYPLVKDFRRRFCSL